jgi:hypothetical protein
MSTNPQPTETDRTPTTTTEITARDGTDRWAAELTDDTPARDTAEQRIAPMVAPLTFDPFCTNRLRNCTDEENAAMPSPDTE